MPIQPGGQVAPAGYRPPPAQPPPFGYPAVMPPPPGPPAKKKHTTLWIVLAVVAGLVVVCCGVGVIGALASNHDKSPSAGSSPAAPPAKPADLSSTAPTSSASPTPTSSAVPAPSASTSPAAPAAPAGPRTLLTLKGTGIKKTAKFLTSDEWTLAYTYDCASFGMAGNFQVWEYTDGTMNDVLVNELDKKGADTTPQHDDPGEHYLEINSECRWTVTVTG